MWDPAEQSDPILTYGTRHTDTLRLTHGTRPTPILTRGTRPHHILMRGTRPTPILTRGTRPHTHLDVQDPPTPPDAWDPPAE